MTLTANAELYALQEIADSISDHGATLIALTPQLAEHSLGMIDKHALTFDMLSDPGNAYASKLASPYTA